MSPEDLLAAARAQGPWDVRSLKESDGLRNGPDYDGATIYYPVFGAAVSYTHLTLPTRIFV